MSVLEQPSLEEIEGIDATLRAWEGTFGVASGFASGDFGWALRNGRDAAAANLLVAREAGSYTVIGWREGDNGLWVQIDPQRLLDMELAETIAAAIDASGMREITCPAVPAAIRRALAARGYAIDMAPWVHLWQPLSDDHLVGVPGVVTTSTEETIAQRVAVQRSAFDGSTFSRDTWQAMAEGPAFVPSLDLVARNDAGEGVAALTAWLPGPDACGVLEPVGTHADHRRQGHASRLMRATFAALRRLGATGVRVYTPRENATAVAAYLANGFRVIDYDTTMLRDAQVPRTLTGSQEIA